MKCGIQFIVTGLSSDKELHHNVPYSTWRNQNVTYVRDTVDPNTDNI